MELAAPERLGAQTNLTPDAALRELMAGNQRFGNNQLKSIDHDLKILKDHTVDKQEPFAAVLACADSRVPVELVFDQTIGHIFYQSGQEYHDARNRQLEYAVASLAMSDSRAWTHRLRRGESDESPAPDRSVPVPTHSAAEEVGRRFRKPLNSITIQADLLRTSSTVIRDEPVSSKNEAGVMICYR
jgi:hypothetical protein